MSEQDFNPSADDRRILSLIDDLQSKSRLSAAPTAAPHEAGASEEIDRPYLELLGIMPYALEQPELPKELGERILGNIIQPLPVTIPAVMPADSDNLASFIPSRSSHDQATVDQQDSPQSKRWLLPLAAGLTALFVGLSTWQFYKIEEQSEMITAISAELSAQSAQNEALITLRTQLASTNSRLALVTNPRVEICALRPVGPEAVYPAARGVLYVAENHQHWYLAMDGLEPRPTGESYQLWFHADDGTVNAGTFGVLPGSKMELSSETMPLGTTAVSITIEPVGGMPHPTGQEVLYGSEVMQIF